MAITIKKDGYGQVEPNHLSAQRTGQIYAQNPVVDEIKVLENGMFLKLDSESGELGGTGNGEWMLVFNEVKLYDNARQGYKDFAVKADETLGTKIYPRMFKTNIGDRYTTNTFKEEIKLTLGDTLVPSLDGLVKGAADATGIKFEVIKEYTMPDGQPAVKVVRVA